MSTITRTLWPSPDNCQLTDSDEQPFDQFGAMLAGVAQSIKDPDERRTLRIRGILTGGIRLVSDHRESDIEVATRRDSVLLQVLQQAQGKGLTPEQIEDALKQFQTAG